jgi:hypothetical protein
MSDSVATAVYVAGGVVGFGALIWIVWTIIRTGWAPWDAAQPVERPE